MKKAIIIAVAVVVVGYIMLPGRAHDEDGITWLTNMDTAREEARSEDRPIFVFFTGSDWCGWCKKLSNEILTKPEFETYASENLVLITFHCQWSLKKNFTQPARYWEADL